MLNRYSETFRAIFTLTKSILPDGRTRWTHYRLGYHLVWIPKFRRKVLQDDVAGRTKVLIAEACARHDLTLISVETDMDHVHVFVSAPPAVSPSDIAKLLKGYSSKKLREDFPHLRKICGAEQLWAQSYYVGSVGDMSAETVRRYIEDCQGR